MVYIAATNSLDVLFLMRLLHWEYPDTRVLVSDPDVLFIAAAGREPLAGTLALSTYPMFFQGGEWATERPTNRKFLFPSPDFEGEYNVIQSLLHDLDAGPLTSVVDDRLRDDSQLDDGQEKRVGLWLLAVTRFGYMPIDWFRVKDSRDGILPHPVAGAPNALAPPTPPRGWFITVVVVTTFIYFGCFLLLRSNLSRSVKQPIWLNIGWNRRTQRLLALWGAGLSLSAIEWILILPAWQSTTAVARWLLAIAVVLPPISMTVVSLTSLNGRWRLREIFSLATALGWLYSLSVAAVLVLALVRWYQLCASSGGWASRFFCFRALDLYSGSSPALPLMLLGCIAFCGFLHYFRRYTEDGRISPRLNLDPGGFPLPEQQAKLLSGLKTYYDGIQRELLAPWPPHLGGWDDRVLAGVLLVAVTLVIAKPEQYIGGFELWGYNSALIAAVALVLVGLITASLQLLRMWGQLRRLLGLVELLPLMKGAFSRISRGWPRRPFRAPQRLFAGPHIAQQMVTALGRRGSAEALQRFTVDRFDPANVHSANCFTVRENYETFTAGLATRVMVHEVTFDSRSSPLNPSAASSREKLRRDASDFVALQFSRYFAYIAGHIRLLASCISVTLLLLIVTLNSYHPWTPLLVGRSLAVLLVAVGSVVIWVFAGMERNAILSRMAHTTPGELNIDFWKPPAYRKPSPRRTAACR